VYSAGNSSVNITESWSY